VRVRFEDFTFDSHSQWLRRGDRTIPLGGKAADVLRVLLEDRPGVVTKGDLFRRVWPNIVVEEASISVAVSALRVALSDDAKQPRFIKTHHGTGYSFCAEVLELGAERHGSQPRVGSRFWLDWNGRSLVLYEGENIVGRDPRCSVWVDEPRVSGRHARIMVSAATATIEDLESLNHTFLRGTQITSVQELAKGDDIRFGVTSLTFRDSAVETERVGPHQATERTGGQRR
jgi:DNA-binding winged helix-turn-helix (wHTH) protein